MSEKFVVYGGRPLRGEVTISGAKNAVLPMLAASLLTNEPVTLNNVPDIVDVRVFLDILRDLGAVVVRKKNSVTITAKDVTSVPNEELSAKMRGSILLAGPLLTRMHSTQIVTPGGCVIGSRPIATHLDGLIALGAKVKPARKHLNVTAPKGLIGNEVVLREISVTGSANILMAATLAHGVTKLKLSAVEPENVAVCEMLVKMGAKISGVGTHTLTITGVKKLRGGSFKVIPDRVEATTFAIAAAITSGNLVIKGYTLDHLEAVTQKLIESGVNLKKVNSTTIQVLPSKRKTAIDVRTDIYPNFPTDVQSIFGTLMCTLKGTSRVFETMFESRLGYFEELAKMGAKINMLNNHQVEVIGPVKFRGNKTVIVSDIRSGAALLVAALATKGKTTIENIRLIDRGYERVEERLTSLGAKIQRV